MPPFCLPSVCHLPAVCLLSACYLFLLSVSRLPGFYLPSAVICLSFAGHLPDICLTFPVNVHVVFWPSVGRLSAICLHALCCYLPVSCLLYAYMITSLLQAIGQPTISSAFHLSVLCISLPSACHLPATYLPTGVLLARDLPAIC
jgi:hypothetical protein